MTGTTSRPDDDAAEWGASPEASRQEFRSPFASIALRDLITDAAIDLLSEGGPSSITLGKVAASLSMQPSSLHSRTRGLGPMLAMLVETFAWRWNRWATSPYAGDRPIRLPRTEAGAEAVRVWLALLELAAGEHRAGRPEALVGLRGAVDDEHAALRHRLTQELGRPPKQAEAHLALAAALGLRTMLAHSFVGVGEDEADAAVELLLSMLSEGVGSPAV